MLKYNLLPILSLLVCLFSCKEKKKISPAPEPLMHYANYSQLKIGNYWVYQIFDVDSLGKGFATQFIDSCYIDKDTIIGGNTFYRYNYPVSMSQEGYSKWLRDSFHYTIDNYGNISFSSADFKNILVDHYALNGIDTFYHVTGKMQDKGITYNVPAGSFSTSDFRSDYKIFEPSNTKTIKKTHSRRAEGVGTVIETMPLYTQDIRYKERRLLRYHVN